MPRAGLLGSVRESPFVDGESRAYDNTGRPTSVEVRENRFDSTSHDILDARDGGQRQH